MDFSTGTLFVSLLFGSIGLGLSIYGRKSQRAPHLLGGIFLMVYPYFVPGVLLQVGVGVGLVAGIYALTRLGW